MRPWAQIISAVDGTDYLSLQLAWFTIFWREEEAAW
jgi:hypothetical protein